MKILTNIQTDHATGIGQALGSLVKYLDGYNPQKIKIIGVEVSGDANNCTGRDIYGGRKWKNLKIIRVCYSAPDFYEVIKNSTGVEGIRDKYSELVRIYRDIINKERPDLVLVNGTYYVPWSLFLAARESGIPIILHYHGILTKELSHLPQREWQLIQRMEKVFDSGKAFYIFPSNLAKVTVEDEVFGHKISQMAILPNPVQDHFFEANRRGRQNNIGIVSRWSRVKNPGFVKKLAMWNRKSGSDLKINLVSDIDKVKEEDRRSIRELVRVVRPMDNISLADFYAKMGVVISPSLFETYGNVAQEALATGTPALVSENMGVAETFKKLGLNDWIIDFDSPAKVYRKIKDVCSQKVSFSVRKEMSENLSVAKINDRMLGILRAF